MTAIKKIMVALAFSTHAESLLNYAASLAERLDADLVVANIINERDVQAVRTISAMGYDVKGATYVDGVRAERLAQLASMLAKIPFPTERIKTVFKIGNPVDELLKICLAEQADLIVMGVKGRTNLETVFIGSVAEKLFRRSPVTVVSFRDPASADKLKQRITA